jgi:hypothetical protein
MNFKINTLFAWLASAALALALGGCNGGDSPTAASTTLTGTAMAGPFLSGTVCAYKVSNGAKGALIGSCTSIVAATSSFSVDVGSYTGDVLVEVTNATYDDEANPNDNTTGTPLTGSMRNLVHVGAAGGTVVVAVTPLTEAALRLAGSTLSDAAVQAAIAQITALLPVDSNLNLRSTLPVSTTTLGLAYREALRALSQLQWGAGTGAFHGDLDGYLANLIGQIGANGNSVAADILSQLNAGLNSNCHVANNMLTCDLPSNTGVTGNYTLTITVSASGVAVPAVTINNVPKPADQTGFCSDTQVQAALQNAAGLGATLTINSCSFDGTTGSIAATVSITTPIAMNIPYTVSYVYSANAGGNAGGNGGNGGNGGAGVAGPAVNLAQLASLCPGAQTSMGGGTQYSGCGGTHLTQNNSAVIAAINTWFSTHSTGMTVYNSNYQGVSVGSSCSFAIEPDLGLWLLTVSNNSVGLTPGAFDGTANSIIEVNAAGEVVRLALGDFMTAGREVSFLNGKIDAVYQSVSGANTTTLFCGNAN